MAGKKELEKIFRERGFADFRWLDPRRLVGGVLHHLLSGEVALPVTLLGAVIHDMKPVGHLRSFQCLPRQLHVSGIIFNQQNVTS